VFKVSRSQKAQTAEKKRKTDSADSGSAESESADSSIPDLFEWSKQLETGIEKVDSQHQNLVAMINRLHRAMPLGKGGEEAGGILDELADYAVYHFGYEEEIFETIDYPDTESHREAHRKAAERIQSFQQQFKDGNPSVAMDLMNFLTEWLKEHIMKTDMGFAPFLKEEQ